MADATREVFSSSYAQQMANMISAGTEKDGYTFQVAMVMTSSPTEREPSARVK